MSRQRARALLANELAETAEFFSFGTNDLTQTTLGAAVAVHEISVELGLVPTRIGNH